MGPFGLGFAKDGIPDNGWKIYVASIVMIIIAGLIVIIRFATRYNFAKLGADDYTIVVSLLFSVVVSMCMCKAVEYGYGAHKAQISKPDLTDALRWFFIAQAPYKVSVCLNKISAVLFCLRIFPSRNFRIAAYTVMGIVVAWSVGSIFATIFQCVPLAASWDKRVQGHCTDKAVFWVAYGVLNIITDVMVLALPIPSIMGLQLKLRERLLLCSVFLLGSFVTVTSILRTTAVSNSVKNNADITYNFTARSIWTIIECNLGIVSACLPALKHLLTWALPRWFGSTRGGRSGYATGGAPGVSAGRGYKMSHMGGNQSAAHGGWSKVSDKASHVIVSVAGPDSRSRDESSDERRIIGDSRKTSLSELESGHGILVSQRVEVSSSQSWGREKY